MEYPSLNSGIYELMHDLGKGLDDPNTLMLGGGNPAILDSTRKFFIPFLKKMSENPDFFRKAFQNYSPPQGNEYFIKTVVAYFKRMTKWQITPEHVCVTQGSQQGFYMLYNYLIGQFNPGPDQSGDGGRPVLVMVKSPDYIGYFDLIPRSYFLSVEGKITDHGDGSFSYGIDFSTLEELLENESHRKKYRIQALVISTPNNPSSHTLSQGEVDRLCRLAEKYDTLLIFDHAYGFPFPDIIFGKKTLYPLTPHTLHCFSFSKIGLPGLRTGIMIGDPVLIEKMIVLNGIINLAPSSFTSCLLGEALQSPSFDQYIQEDLFSYYREKKEIVFQVLKEKLQGTPAMIHQPQGGFFLWLWAPNFPLSSYQIYEILKKEKVVVVPGNYFFLHPPDKDAYLRISYTMEKDVVIRGVKIIGETLKYYFQKHTLP